MIKQAKDRLVLEDYDVTWKNWDSQTVLLWTCW